MVILSRMVTINVERFDRLKLFSKGDSESQRYRGARDLTSLLAFIKETLSLEDSKVMHWKIEIPKVSVSISKFSLGKCC